MPATPTTRTTATLALALTLCAPTGAPGKDVTPASLSRGLITTYRDAATPPRELTRLEPTVALSLKAGEAPHPRLGADGGTVRWQGYVNITRADTYQFRARLRGKLIVRVGGKELLAAEVKGDRPEVKAGPATRLEAGVHPLTAEFTRLPGAAAVELFWSAGHFREEPLPYDFVGHRPDQRPARFEEDALAEQGRFLAEEYSCTRCHQPADGNKLAKTLQPQQGPDLSKVGRRVRAGWLYHWLGKPHELRPGTAMPALFADDGNSRVERYAAARYLASLGGPPKEREKRPRPKRDEGSIRRGKELYHSTGCAACHGPTEEVKRKKRNDEEDEATPTFVLHAPPKVIPLTDLGGKTTAEQLAKYLQNPHATSPGGRMPNMLLSGKEAEDLARYLCDRDARDRDAPQEPGSEELTAALRRLESRPEEQKKLDGLPGDRRWVELGRRVVAARRCTGCHTIEPAEKYPNAPAAVAGLEALADSKRQHAGCLADDAKERGTAPDFALAEGDRKALRAFLANGLDGAGSPAPAHAARVALRRFNCLACHSRDGEGGVTPPLVEVLRRYEKAEHAEAVVPPPLTGVGHKLRTSWLREVLTRAGRARPWMGLRMPQFGEGHVGPLAEGLAALEGAEPDDSVHQVALSGAKVEAGRLLAGKPGFGCVSCHDVAGIPNFGTRGPDLATATRRVRFDWYTRWLEQAQRIQPGTRMPTVFPEGKSQLDKVCGGDARAQSEALWAYLSLGPTLPLPDGIETRPKGMELVVGDRPVVFRTFLPDAGTRAIAVGYPGGTSVAFDAATGRLAYAWAGPFLDARPVWGDRGGNPAKVLGTRFWAGPKVFPWFLDDDPRAIAGRAKDPGFGAPLPEGEYHDGPRPLRFEGYTTDGKGRPTFRYRLDAGDGRSLGVREATEPKRSPAGLGLTRRFTVQMIEKRPAWLLVGETQGTPRFLDRKGEVAKLDLKGDRATAPAAGHALALPDEGGRVVVLTARQAPAGARWALRRFDGRWHALLELPATEKGGKLSLALDVWVPYRDEPGLLKELLSKK
jgi:mono/diheme cytochrome c family protein